jgi:hypothetical protein
VPCCGETWWDLLERQAMSAEPKIDVRKTGGLAAVVVAGVKGPVKVGDVIAVPRQLGRALIDGGEFEAVETKAKPAKPADTKD